MIRPWALCPLLFVLWTGSASAAQSEGTDWIDELGLRPGLPLVVLPPAAGALVGLLDTRKIDSYVETLVLRGDPGTFGRNTVTATVTRNGLAPRIDQADIEAETAEVLPGIAMALAPGPGRNSLGVFGYSLGRQGPATCIYAWQSVNLADRWLTGSDPGPFAERHALSIRVRLCRTGATEAELAGAVAQLGSLASGGGGLLVGSSAIGGGYDALAAAQGAEHTVVDLVPAFDRGLGRRSQPARPVRRRRSASRLPRAAPPSSPSPPSPPLAGMPVVPLPQ